VRIEKLEREYDIQLEYINFPLHPDTPAEGISLAKMFGGDTLRIRTSQDRMRQLAAAEGLPMSARTMTYNSRLAQELGVWAVEKGKGPAFHNAAFRAYFVDGKNISDAGVLAALAASVGLDSTAARAVVEQRTYRKAVDDQWNRSYAAGVNAVPTFEAGAQRIVGAQPYERLAQMLEAAGARKRTAP
jgi:predicted DsbA family dithiol-disulfide isomerase